MTWRRHVLGAVLALAGAAFGLGLFTFAYARGGSYLTTDPAACANCHVMAEHYAAWQRSSHRAVATCADCHMPHDLVGKYLAKSTNGFWHSLAFTTGRFPDPLQIKPHNRAITEQTCRDCHQAIVDAIDPDRDDPPARAAAAGRSSTDRPQIHDGAVASTASRESCIRCHTYVGHAVR
jgi:cytochrome c nitrite reductase small subunit